jgi:hypothetical protein
MTNYSNALFMKRGTKTTVARSGYTKAGEKAPKKWKNKTVNKISCK